MKDYICFLGFQILFWGGFLLLVKVESRLTRKKTLELEKKNPILAEKLREKKK